MLQVLGMAYFNTDNASRKEVEDKWTPLIWMLPNNAMGRHLKTIYFENFKAEFKPNKTNKKWNWTKGPCQELLFKDQIAIKRRYSWGISPSPYYKTDQSTQNGTAGVSPPYLTVWRIYPSKKVQLGYLPLTLLHDGSVHAGGYSWGISPLPYCVADLSIQESTAGVSPPYLTAWQTSTTAACWSQSTGRILGHWSNTYCPCPRSPAGMHQ